MRTNNDIERLRTQAERARRCFYPTSRSQQQAAYARTRVGQLVRPYRNMYADSEYWSTLPPPERSRHIIRTMAQQYPGRVFAGLSAAAILSLEYPWGLHADGLIYIAAPRGRSAGAHPQLRHIVMTDTPVRTVVDCLNEGRFGTFILPDPATYDGIGDVVNTMRITTPARTLVDCGLRYPFVQTLPMFDSALRRNLATREELLELCDGLRTDCGPVMRLLRYANPLNENGGESLCYGTIIEEGFAVPELQHVFIDPDDPRARYRADFVWHTSDGRVIVLEYDGTRKYVDPAMTNRRDVRDVVRRERAREDALRRAKVTAIIRTDYDEVIRRTPLRRKLLTAGVPMAVADPRYERRLDMRGREW
ncbi:CTP synthase [Bifidobacterium callimiconis]|uniref:CTP synthase n=1 Tax=Bifidobacterium callimiconis TaxID=2306973 RepID=UPI001F0A1B11|nr:CTP synthase [Bifidobacterium callimiconis]